MTTTETDRIAEQTQVGQFQLAIDTPARGLTNGLRNQAIEGETMPTFDDGPKGWPRDSYTGPGGGLYTGPGGGLYTGPGGGSSTSICGGLSTSIGGGLSTAIGGGLSTAIGGGLSTAIGGGLSTAIGGGLSTAIGGGLSTTIGGGLYTGPYDNPYHSNIPPRATFLEHLRRRGYHREYQVLKAAWGL